MKAKIRFLLVLLFCSLAILAQGQKRALNFSAGISITKPDKRVFRIYNPFTIERINNDRPSYLNEFFYNFSTHLKLKRKFDLTIGMGTSVIFNDASRIIYKAYFFPGHQQLRGWWNGWYFNTSLQPNIGIKKNIINRGDWNYYLGINNAFSLSLHKSMYGNGFPLYHKFSRVTLEPFTNELFISTGLEKGRRSYHLDFRAIHMKFLDEAIENNGKSLDFYNPFKVRLRVGYNLHAVE